eukprot:651415_1
MVFDLTPINVDRFALSKCILSGYKRNDEILESITYGRPSNELVFWCELLRSFTGRDSLMVWIVRFISSMCNIFVVVNFMLEPMKNDMHESGSANQLQQLLVFSITEIFCTLTTVY